MRIRTAITAAAIAATGFTAVTAGPAAAEERVCRGTIGAISLDDVRVPTNATCTLNGTQLNGSVVVGRNATLRAVGARINGNVQGEGSAAVRVLQGSRVGGSFQAVQGGAVALLDSRVGGDVLADDNDRAVADGEEEGFVKIHTRKGSDKILGATIVARQAGDMINEITLAMVAGIGLKTIGDVIHPYPTQAEAIARVAGLYSRTRLTPTVKNLSSGWLQFNRR